MESVPEWLVMTYGVVVCLRRYVYRERWIIWR